MRAVREGELDRLHIPPGGLDVLAQQIVAEVAGDEWGEDELYDAFGKAWPYRELKRETYDEVVRMLAEGFTTRRGRQHAYLHHDRVNKRLRSRRGARLAAITSGGAIPDTADYDVVLEPGETFVGTVNEDFAVESIPGDVFQLGNSSWRILRIERGRVRVEDAHGQPPSLPFWLGEAPARTEELSSAVSRLRAEAAERLSANGDLSANGKKSGREHALQWLVEDLCVPPEAAEQLADYLAASRQALGDLPTRQTIVMERFFDESGGMQLVIHSPFGSRINRAWGLALRKRFCRKFNFELQAAATEDAIVLSLGSSQSFPLEEVFHYLNPDTVRDVLVQALLAAPMFTVRWRWNANIALAILRRRGGKKNPPFLQRMQAEDLITSVFPDQLACAENLAGEREVPDHPLVNQTIEDCLHEAMDIDGLEHLLTAMQTGALKLVAKDLTEPSPLAHEILSARPYAFLDDAPLEERRTQAVMARRWLDPESTSDLGRLDPEAIERVREEIWPRVESADELHDALVQMSFLSEDESAGWNTFFHTLVEEGRAATLRIHEGGTPVRIAIERLAEWKAAFPEARWMPDIRPFDGEEVTADDALRELVRGRLEGLGPVTARGLAESASLPPDKVEAALWALENEGFVLRGRFSPQAEGEEWCARRLLARIHRYTLNRLRQEIQPVTSVEYLRFLTEWQEVKSDTEAVGPESLARILEGLGGYEAPAAAWESDILTARMPEYDPMWLDSLCLSGRIVWKRLSPARGAVGNMIRTTPIALISRRHRLLWDSLFIPDETEPVPFSGPAEAVRDALAERGALFFSDIVSATRLLPAMVEDALAELVARGLVTSDSFMGLRALLTPSNLRPREGGSRRRRALFGIEDAGRWSLLRPPSDEERMPRHEALEELASMLLRRYGVVFRKLLEREAWTPPWRELLYVYRRMEDRGEVRGGRFIGGFWGEQFALPEAVSALRAARKSVPTGENVAVSGADPLNLLGILTPGGRVPAISANRILIRDGEPVAVLEGGRARSLVEGEAEADWSVQQALVQRRTPGALRAYLGRGARAAR